MMEKSSSNNSMNKKRKSTKLQTECRICGASAIYSYFGVVSCHPCKMFFKRTAERGKEVFKCLYDGDCEININNRHVCSYCRLVKCFNSGMQIELIRSSFTRLRKVSRKKKSLKNLKQTASTTLFQLNEPEQVKSRYFENTGCHEISKNGIFLGEAESSAFYYEIKRHTNKLSFPTLNLLQSDQSMLTIDQWNLLSNLSHCYDEHSGLSIGEHFMLEQNALPLKLRFKKEQIKKLIQISLDKCQSLYKNNRDFLSLSIDDRSVLLHSTFTHTAHLSANFIIYKTQLLNYPTYINIVEMLTHPGLVSATKPIADQLYFDMIIMKLFLVILSFSTTRYTVYSNTPPVNLSNIKEILRIQDTYIEITWRYLLYKYNFERSVICLSDLIRCFCAIHEAIVKVHDIPWPAETISSIVQQTEETLTLN
ncbi:unnamed protein product [Rotaria sordida]|uniref:Nuclear receptor domain-containing protein n=1 Tax=Rotaria sordida TaxID=392033 RepID=A0A819FXT1_9BILA|nr:unnamed protein product [Rotaria sordida]